MLLIPGRVLLSILFVKCFHYVSADENTISDVVRSRFYNGRSDDEIVNIKSLQDTMKSLCVKVESEDNVSELIKIFFSRAHSKSIGDRVRLLEIQQHPDHEVKALKTLKDDSRLLGYQLRYKILTLLMNTAEKFTKDLDIVKSSNLKWIPDKLWQLKDLLNDLKNEIWWLRQVNVMEYVQNIHKRLMRILISMEQLSQLSTSVVLQNFYSGVSSFIENQVNAFLEAAY